jgi:host factor-I protein
MAGKRMPNLQDTFLNHVRKSKIPLAVFLVNGVKLQGILTWFDSFSILLKQSAESQLVYKHAISTIMLLEPIQLSEHDDGAEPAPRFRSDDA